MIILENHIFECYTDEILKMENIAGEIIKTQHLEVVYTTRSCC